MCKWGNVITFKKMNPRSTKATFQVDRCIAPAVKALNKVQLYTIASCCGHGKRPGNIVLADGREIFIIPNYDMSRKVDEFLNQIIAREK